MDNNYTHISILLDESGSMSSKKQDVVGGINEYLKIQKEVPGKATVSLYTFDGRGGDPNYLRRKIDFEDILNVSDFNDFHPRGMTPLLDATVDSITEVGEKLASLSEDQRPAKVLFIIFTDGLENTSQTQTKDSVKNLISQQTDIYKWDFAFLGANQDSFANASAIGINYASTTNYTFDSAGISGAFSGLAFASSGYRCSTVGTSFTLNTEPTIPQPTFTV